MDNFKKLLYNLINIKLRELFQIEDIYDISIFKTLYDNQELMIKISPCTTPRLNIKCEESSILNKEHNIEIDLLCKYITHFELDFYTIITKLIKNTFENYIENTVDLNINIDGLIIKFKIH
jgi:hypothetical protein